MDDRNKIALPGETAASIPIFVQELDTLNATIDSIHEDVDAIIRLINNIYYQPEPIPLKEDNKDTPNSALEQFLKLNNGLKKEEERLKQVRAHLNKII